MTYQGQTGMTNTGADPAYVPDREVFDAYTHQQIWDLAHERLAPAELRRVAEAWGDAADALESAFGDHARTIGRLSGEWSGSAAAAAAHAATALVLAGDDTVGVCRVLRQLMTANSDAAESVRTAIPPPPEPYRPDPDSAAEAATGGPRRTAYNTAAAAATAAAQDAMTFGYNPSIPASGDSVPRFPVVVATAAENPGVSVVPGPRGATATPTPESGGPAESAPGTTAGSDPGPPPDDSPESTAAHTDGDTVLAGAPDGPDEEPQPLFGNDSAPPRATREEEPQSSGTSTESPREAESPAGTPESPAETTGPAAESPHPANNPEHESSQPVDATAPAAGSTPDTRPAHAEPAVQPAASPVDRGTGPVGSPGATDPAARTPAGPPVGGTVAPLPAGPGPTPAQSGPVPHSSPGVAGGNAAAPGHGSPTGNTPGHSSPTGNTPGAGHPPAANTPRPQPAPGFPDPVPARPPTGHTDPVARPPLRADREPLDPAGTVPGGSGTERQEHPGPRPPRPVPAGVPLSSAGGTPPARSAGSERTSPGYLQAPNEELTATDPKVPPVLGEYTDAERAERVDPGGGSR